MNHRLTFLVVLALLALILGPAFAGDFFERNNLAIDGYDPVPVSRR